MDRPRGISSGEAMRWNEDVNRRRLEHHERRCAEDAMYRKAYEYQQTEERRMWEQMHKPLAQMLAAEAQQRREASETKSADKPQRATFRQVEMSGEGRTPYFSRALGLGIIATMLADHGKLMQRMKELEEMKPYLDEIRETDKRFRDEEIQLSCWEW